MAQISFRINDDSKRIADQVLETHGLSVGGYLQGIVEYIAQNQSLPVVIEFRPVAHNPEEVFQEAIYQFREVYVSWMAFSQNELQVNQMTPQDKLHQLFDNLEAAYSFYQRNESIIRQAPSQLEKLGGDDPNYSVMFSRCIEYFPPLCGFLREAVRTVNMGNRPVQQGDLDVMKSALEQAAKAINTLQGMAYATVTTETLTRFMLRDMEEALGCAYEATQPHISYMIANAWTQRMDKAFDEALKKYKRLGISDQNVALSRLKDEVNLAVSAVKEYIDTTSEPMTGFNMQLLNLAQEQLSDMEHTLGYVSVALKANGRPAE